MTETVENLGCAYCLMHGRPGAESARPLSQYPGFKHAPWSPTASIKEGTNHVLFCNNCKTVWAVEFQPREIYIAGTDFLKDNCLKMIGADALPDDFINFPFTDDYHSVARKRAVLRAGESFFRYGTYSCFDAANSILAAINKKDLLFYQAIDLLNFFYVLLQHTARLRLDSIKPILELAERSDIFDTKDSVSKAYERKRIINWLQNVCSAGFHSNGEVLFIPAEEKAGLLKLTGQGDIMKAAFQTLHKIDCSELEKKLDTIIRAVIEIDTNVDYVRRITEKEYLFLQSLLKHLTKLQKKEKSPSGQAHTARYQLSVLVERIHCMDNLVEK